MTLKSLVILCFMFLVTACKDKYSPVFTDTITVNNQYKPNGDTVLADSIQGFLYSRLSKTDTYGMRTHFKLPEKSQGKNMYVLVTGRSRNSYVYSQGVILVIAHSKKNEQICWEAIKMRLLYTEINKWVDFRDSIMLPPDFYGTEYNLITVKSHLPKGPENFDLDGLNVTIMEKQ